MKSSLANLLKQLLVCGLMIACLGCGLLSEEGAAPEVGGRAALAASADAHGLEEIALQIESGLGQPVGEVNFQRVAPICESRIAAPDRHSLCELFVGVSSENEVFLFSPRNLTGQLLGELPGFRGHIAVSADGESLIVAEKNQVVVRDLVTLHQLHLLDRVPAHIQDIQVSPRDDVLLIGGADGRVYRWSWKVAVHPSERRLGRFDVERYFQHAQVVSAVAFHPGGRVFFSGDWQGLLVAWKGYEQDPYQGAYDKNIFGTGFFSEAVSSRPVGGTIASRIEDLVVSPDGDFLIASYASGDIDIWSIRGMRKALRLNHHRGAILNLAVSPAALAIATYGRDQRLVISQVQRKTNVFRGDLEFEAKKLFEERIVGVSGVFFSSGNEILLIRTDGPKLVNFAKEMAK